MEAAREVFGELGFDAAKISDIAKRAKISYGTFYHYFDSKDEVLQELLTVVAGEMFLASRVPAGVSEDPVAKIDAANRQYVAALSRNAQLMAIIEEKAFRDPAMRDLKLRIREQYLQRSEAGLRRLQEEGRADPDVDARMAAVALGGMVEHLAHLWFIHGVPFDEDLALTTLTALWANAIGLRRSSSPE